MAFINKEEVKTIREALKKAFPNARFRLSGSNSSMLTVKVVKAPDLYPEPTDVGINHYWVHTSENEAEAKFWGKVDEVVNTAGNWFDKSDMMTDYFHTAFYKNYRVEVK